MASKRKKSRPTKIERDENSLGYEDDCQSDFGEDLLNRIQRYIEEGSEDTPDACSERVSWSPVKKILGQNDLIPLFPSNGTTPDEGGFPNLFSIEHVPSNLKFHQLQVDEIESIENTTAESVLTDSEKIKANGHIEEERISFKQVPSPAPKKSPSKRAKVADDEVPRYTCSTCKYVTNRSDHYKRHLMTHSTDKPLKCSMCNYSTGRSDHYKRHLQRHGLSEKDIIETCSRNGLKLKSTSLSALSDTSNETTNADNILRKRQSNSKPVDGPVRKRYKCEICSYATDKMSHFTRHQSCHTKKGVIKCDKCNKSFKSKSYFSQHKCRFIRTVLSERHCPICTTIFINKNAVMLHVAREHCDSDKVKNGDTDSTGIDSNDSVADCASDKSQYNSKESVDSASELTSAIRIIDVEVIETSEPIDLRTGEHSLKTKNFQSTEISDVEVTKETLNESSGSENMTKVEIDKTSENTEFLPKLPSPLGNLGCTKCGVWFNKLNEYSSHTCVS